MRFRDHLLVPCLAVALLAGCGSSSPDSDVPLALQTGSVSLPLRAAVGERTFELRDAVFLITGTTELELSANDTPEALFLEQALPVGDYNLAIEPGWSLVELSDAEPVAAAATLISGNPQSFRITDSVRTELDFRFELEAGEDEVTLGSGTLSLAIEVVPHQAGTVVFTELMANPAELADSDGEWFELMNVSDSDVTLERCTVERDATTAFTIGASLTLAPGGTATLAVSAAPGFEPVYAYSGLSLPNSGSYTLGLRCGSAVLDTVSVDASTWPGASGVAASLDPAAASASGNDSASAWCSATTAYNSDLGSPGAANPVCG